MGIVDKLSQPIDKEIIKQKNQIDLIHEVLETANENGLLKNDLDSYTLILTFLIDALKEISNTSPNIGESKKKTSLAYFHLNQKINSAPLMWRLTNVYGLLIVLYFSIVFLGWIYISSGFIQSEILGVPSWAYSWGLLGGILRGFWWSCENIWRRALRKYWHAWWFLLPFIGAILGALAFLIADTGLIAITGDVEVQSDNFIMLLSALSGFSSRKAVEQLNNIVTKIFSPKK